MPTRITGMIRQLLRDGCFEIESSFDYKGATFTLKTFIQPDADIVTIIGIPQLSEYGPSELEVDEAGAAMLMKNYTAHNRKVVEAFEELDGRRQFWGTAIDVSLVASNVYSISDAFLLPEGYDGKMDLGFYMIDVPQLASQINPDFGTLLLQPGVLAYATAMVTAGLSIYFRRFLRHHGAALITSVLFKLVSWFMEWRSNRRKRR